MLLQNRRNFLQAMSSLPLIGWLFNPHSSEASFVARRDFFKELGVRPFINAAGTYTHLTASLMPPEVIEAMDYAAKQFVNLIELHNAVGKRIAGMIGCEAAMVTSGAAAAMTVGTAACITGKNLAFIKRIPDLTEMKNEVIVQKSHRVPYDHAIRNCGVKMIEVETVEELEKAINPLTAMMFFLAYRDSVGKIKAEDFVALGKKHNIPTITDAAANLPPTEHLSRYTKIGFDLVAFSGGKALRGPQSCGLLLGRKDLIEAARLNGGPDGDSIGRGMKVSKEEIIGMMVAVESYIKRDAAAEWKEWERRVKVLADSVASVRTMKATTYIPPIAHHTPHLRLAWEKAALKLSGADVQMKLREGNPSIETTPTPTPAMPLSPLPEGFDQILVGVWTLQPGEIEIVARRLREVFQTAY